ncbi:MAG TPA: TPM domain-containing protein [Planctomycetaceae bacterium]|nr:TPM domain-containing protein [Planctomycetaceae bacterium]HQZ66866.1 TPM domain-containing protein [Planctomycetaceae bacterium]
MLFRWNRQAYRVGHSCVILTLLAVGLFALSVGSSSVSAQSPVPEFTGERLVFSDVDPVEWQSLVADVSEFEQTAKLTCYVVVIKSSGTGPTATKDYTDRLYAEWAQQSIRDNILLDRERSVVIVLAMENRQLSVHVGQELLDSSALTAKTVDEKLVGPHFIRFAKAGNYPEGIKSLLSHMGEWITTHEQSVSIPQSQPQLPTPSVARPAEVIVPGTEIAQTPPVKQPVVIRETQPAPEAPASPPSEFLSLPFAIAGAAVMVGLLTLLILRWLHLRIRRPLELNKQSFREHVVQLSDDIDALRERHRMLPFTDKDYTSPMMGETLALYDGVQETLQQLRQRWLELMDVWDKIDALTKSEHYFGRGALLEAAALLKSVPVSDVEKSLNEQCVQSLDRLEDAHEQVERLKIRLDEQGQRLQQQFSDLQAVQLQVEPYHTSLAKVVELRSRAAEIAVADPIGSQTLQTAAGDVLRDVGQLTEKILQHRRGIDELREKLRKTSERLADLRGGGMKFCEEESDPSPLFPQVEHYCNECLQLLNLGDVETSAEHLKQGFELVSSAKSTIQRQVDAKEFCEREIPLRTSEQRKLEAQLQPLDSVLIALENEFAAVSWHALADLRSTASTTVSHCAAVLSEATLAGSSDVQHYQKAALSLQQLKQSQGEASMLIASGDQRLHQLQQLRAKTQAELIQLEQYRQRVASLLQSSAADRVAANRRFQDADRDLQQLKQTAARSRANWPDIADSVENARREISTAEQMAQEDIRLVQQATQEIMTAQRELRQAESFYRSGFRANVVSVRPRLLSARQALDAQQYERAIELANATIADARQQLRQAEREADEAERRRENERREHERRDRARTMGTGIGIMSGGIGNAASVHQSSVHHTSIQPASPAPASSSGSTSSSSWSSETSQSSW